MEQEKETEKEKKKKKEDGRQEKQIEEKRKWKQIEGKENTTQNKWKNLCYPQELIETDGHPITKHPLHHRLWPTHTHTKDNRLKHEWTATANFLFFV